MFPLGKTGDMAYKGSAQFTSGVLAIVPPTTSTVTTSSNLDTFTVQSAVLGTMADKTVGFKIIDNKIVFVYKT